MTRVAGRDSRRADKNAAFVDSSSPTYVSDIYIAMGLTAENVAARWKVQRADMDEYAVRSHERALAAQPRASSRGDYRRSRLGTVGEMTGTTVRVPTRRRPTRRTQARVHPEGESPPATRARSATEPRRYSLCRRIARRTRADARGCGSSLRRSPVLRRNSWASARWRRLAGAEATRMTIRDVDVIELNEAFAPRFSRCVASSRSTSTPSSIHTAARSRSAIRSV